LHRQERQRNLGAPGITDYTNPAKVEAELAHAQEVYLRLGCTVLDVTDKPAIWKRGLLGIRCLLDKADHK
jgi:regulator of PEP synthase PpsR (kinase-PPPase family)